MKQTSETTFEPDWLALREPADHAARDLGLLKQAAALVRDGASILDLGSGTGSTARAFSVAGLTDLHWHFFDQDAALLDLARSDFPAAECIVGDIADIGALPLDGVGLITASALFDLMSEAWAAALLARARKHNVPIYAALNYDGEMQWTPTHEQDAEITNAFNTHQTSDKGTGPAMGPAAATKLAQLAKSQGCDVYIKDSPWRLGTEHTRLHAQLVDGIAQAAHEAGASDSAAWRRIRHAAIPASTALIGHQDILIIPPKHGMTGTREVRKEQP